MSGNFSVEAKGTFIVVVASKFPEEHLKLIFPYFKATVSFLGEHFPYSVELVQVIFEGLDWTVVGEVVLIKLLNNDQYEKL